MWSGSLGPCIHAECYEFSARRPRPRGRRATAARCGRTARRARPALDLAAGGPGGPEAAGADLVPGVDACTACGGGQFSHRARGDRGRQALVVWSMRPREPARDRTRRPVPGVREPPGGPPGPHRGGRRRTRPAVTVVAGDQGVRCRGGADRALAAGLTAWGRTTPTSWWPRPHEWPASPARPPSGTSSGAVQRNKVARLAPLVACWQGVARIEEGSW